MKIQIKFQKILFLVTLIIAAIALVYGFSFCTGSITYAIESRSGMFPRPYRDDPIGADALYQFVMGKGEYNGEVWADGGVGFNDLIVVLAVVFIVIAALQFFFATNSRRNYYLTNYISVGILVAFAVVVAIVGFWGVAHTEALFNGLDWEKYKSVYDRIQEAIKNDQPVGVGWRHYSDSHAIFALGYVLYAIILVDAIVLALNTVWKYLLMKGEKNLLLKNQNITEAEVVNEQGV